MTEGQVPALLDRIASWPPERRQELVDLALEIEAEFNSSGDYHATPDELQAIDEGLADEVASPEEVAAAFASFRRG